MNYWRIIFFITILFAPHILRGQDVIVKKDGSTIISKVLEVTPDNIKYKKLSNLNGPTYTINVVDVMAVNYANGEKETFDKAQETKVSDKVEKTQLSQTDQYINDAVISSYNDRSVTCNLAKPIKHIDWIYRLLKIHSSSIIGNSEGRIHINIMQKRGEESIAYLNVGIENTTDEMMYIDLGNTTFRTNSTASTYYVNSSTTKTKSSGGGASVNIGSITGALGIGGIIGAVAHGVNVGGGNSSSTSTTVYAERIITVAPHSTYWLNSKKFYEWYMEKAYKTNFKYGDVFNYKQPESITTSPWEIIVSYAMARDLNDMKFFRAGLYISQELSVSKKWDKCIVNETGLAPIHYFYFVGR